MLQSSTAFCDRRPLSLIADLPFADKPSFQEPVSSLQQHDILA